MFQTIADLVEFVANLLTIGLGAVAVWGLIFRGEELSLALHAVANFRFHHQVHRLKLTLTQLGQLSHDEKNQRPEVLALFGQMLGQLTPLSEEFPELKNVTILTQEFLSSAYASKRSESRKRAITHQVEGLLDRLAFDQSKRAVKKKVE